MKILTYLEDCQERVGSLTPEGVVDLSAEFPSVLELIERLAADVDAGERLARLVADGPRVAVDPARLEILAPIPRPRRNLFCVGWNYAKHHEEGTASFKIELPEWPTFFTKPTTSVIGHRDAIEHDGRVTEMLDYEAELAVVIGRGGRGIREEDARDHIFGYTLANDVSARDLQKRHGGQWFKGKALDSSCPLGPWIVTRDEIMDPQALAISCEVNGKQLQDGSTADMIFSISRLIAELSRGMTLLPGDILLTGTPDGVGAHREPPIFLNPGDCVRVRCDAIGILENPVVASDLMAPPASRDPARSPVERVAR